MSAAPAVSVGADLVPGAQSGGPSPTVRWPRRAPQVVTGRGGERRTHYVQKGGSRRGVHATVAEALQAAAPYERVEISPGRYFESIVVQKPLEIAAEPGVDCVELCSHGATLTLDCEEVWLHGVTVKTAERQYAVVVQSGEPTVTECVIDSMSVRTTACPYFERNRVVGGKLHGIHLTSRAGGTFRYNTVTQHHWACIFVESTGKSLFEYNVVDGGQQSQVIVSGQEDEAVPGIVGQVEVVAPVFRNNRISDKIEENPALKARGTTDKRRSSKVLGVGDECTICLGTPEQRASAAVTMAKEKESKVEACWKDRAAVEVSSSAAPVFERNWVCDGINHGFVYASQAAGILTQNHVVNNQGAGVYTAGGANPLVTQNDLTGNRKGGIIAISDSSGAVRGNRINGNGGFGFTMSGGKKSTGRRREPMELARNDVQGNERGGLLLRDEAECLVTDNNLAHNNGPGILVSHGANPTCVNNQVVGNRLGILCVDGGRGVYTKNEILQCQRYCAVVAHRSHPEMTDNRFSNSGSGLLVTQLGKGLFKGNKFYQNHGPQVVVRDGGHPHVIFNHLSAGREEAVLCLSGGRGIFSRNYMSLHFKDTVMVRSGADPQFTENHISEPASNGIRVCEGGKGLYVWNTIDLAKGAGVSVAAQGQPTMRCNTIRKCRGPGILIEPGGAGRYEKNSCDHNTVGLLVQGEMRRSKGPVPLFTANLFCNNLQKGIWVTQRAAVHLLRNVVRDSVGPAVYVDHGGAPVVIGNTVERSQSQGVVVCGGQGHFIQNTIVDSGEASVEVTGLGAAPVFGNNIISAEGIAVKLDQRARGVFAENIIRGVTVQGRCKTIGVTVGDGVLTRLSSNVINECETGLKVHGKSKAVFTANVITGCEWRGVHITPEGQFGDITLNAICGQRDGAVSAGAGLLSGNFLFSNTGANLAAEGGSTTRMEHNIIFRGRHGVQLRDGAVPLLRNVITENEVGIMCTGRADPTCTANLIYGNKDAGVLCDGKNARGHFVGNSVYANGACNIEIRGEASPLIERNSIRAAAAGVRSTDSARGIVRSNSLYGHTVAAVHISGGATVIDRNRMAWQVDKAAGVLADAPCANGERSLVSGNLIRDNAFGVWSRSEANPILRGNDIIKSSEIGILINQRGMGRFEGNRLFDNDMCGAVLRGEGCDPHFLENEIVSNVASGAVIEDNAQGLFERNLFAYNRTGTHVTTQADPLFRNNRFVNNIHYGLYISQGAKGRFMANQFDFEGEEDETQPELASPRRTRAASSFSPAAVRRSERGKICYPVRVEDAGTEPYVEGSRVTGSQGPGVQILSRAGCELVGNIIECNSGCGLEVSDHAEPVVRENTIRRNRGEGIILAVHAGGTYEENEVTLNGQGGISIRFAAGTFFNNRVHEEPFGGIKIEGASSHIRGNNISFCNYFGVSCQGESKPIIEHNRFYENRGPAVLLQGGCASLSENLFHCNGENGAVVIREQGSKPRVSRNIFAAEQRCVFVTGGGAGTITNNVFCHCSGPAALVLEGACCTAEANVFFCNAQSAICAGDATARAHVTGNVVCISQGAAVVCKGRCTASFSENIVWDGKQCMLLAEEAAPTCKEEHYCAASVSCVQMESSKGPVFTACTFRNARQAGLAVRVGDPVCEGCTFTENLYGVEVRDHSTGFVARKCSFRSHRCGILFHDASGRLEECVMHYNHAGCAIRMHGADPVLKGCRLWRNSKGVWAQRDAQGHVEMCDMFYNDDNIAADGDSTSSVFQHCQIHDAKRYGVHTAGGRITVQECNLFDNREYAVLVEGGTCVLVTNKIWHQQEGGAVRGSGNAAPVLRGNAIVVSSDSPILQDMSQLDRKTKMDREVREWDRKYAQDVRRWAKLREKALVMLLQADLLMEELQLERYVAAKDLVECASIATGAGHRRSTINTMPVPGMSPEHAAEDAEQPEEEEDVGFGLELEQLLGLTKIIIPVRGSAALLGAPQRRGREYLTGLLPPELLQRHHHRIVCVADVVHDSAPVPAGHRRSLFGRSSSVSGALGPRGSIKHLSQGAISGRRLSGRRGSGDPGEATSTMPMPRRRRSSVIDTQEGSTPGKGARGTPTPTQRALTGGDSSPPPIEPRPPDGPPRRRSTRRGSVLADLSPVKGSGPARRASRRGVTIEDGNHEATIPATPGLRLPDIARAPAEPPTAGSPSQRASMPPVPPPGKRGSRRGRLSEPTEQVPSPPAAVPGAPRRPQGLLGKGTPDG
eukprot:TRINITY_DN4247_c0_g1_i1.p1 TRINITY_DN4247_c0_g1~~TRINITY_DN4247_c0_g1_i1.p1  ORF type:complete len:2274 (+),score=674.29 TRINITY_DN4247_c0_g1_i1:137-6823(+)